MFACVYKHRRACLTSLNPTCRIYVENNDEITCVVPCSTTTHLMAISWFLRFLIHLHEDLLLLFSITSMVSWGITETIAVAGTSIRVWYRDSPERLTTILKKTWPSGWWFFALPLWKMMEWKSVGMITFPIWWESHKSHVPNHQPVIRFDPFPYIDHKTMVNFWKLYTTWLNIWKHNIHNPNVPNHHQPD